jgi:hypothetical protein
MNTFIIELYINIAYYTFEKIITDSLVKLQFDNYYNFTTGFNTFFFNNYLPLMSRIAHLKFIAPV